MSYLPHFELNKNFRQKYGLYHFHIFIKHQIHAKNQTKQKTVRKQCYRRTDGRTDKLNSWELSAEQWVNLRAGLVQNLPM